MFSVVHYKLSARRDAPWTSNIPKLAPNGRRMASSKSESSMVTQMSLEWEMSSSRRCTKNFMKALTSLTPDNPTKHLQNPWPLAGNLPISFRDDIGNFHLLKNADDEYSNWWNFYKWKTVISLDDSFLLFDNGKNVDHNFRCIFISPICEDSKMHSKNL